MEPTLAIYNGIPIAPPTAKTPDTPKSHPQDSPDPGSSYERTWKGACACN
ncbi:hypothetical protein AM1_C0356 (plasmid) [Acaryochloris marina MBIC11017]|uniref:Uncharacterized protein n=1 Tax=Acaryochloris marina (strain MBIC 11017) TaxID=329726 RepID=A8ZN84_ACAM1|nr:hypothetical protein AM1_C0356 [Acaryochloris marina MBIC11017]